jgi:phosphoglycerol transferase MdoB-like AlkP superfamily enzyme
METPTRWHNYTNEFYRFFLLWLSGVVFLGAFRILMFFAYSDRAAADTVWSDYTVAIHAGFKFDSAAVCMFLLFPFLANILFQPFRLEKIVQYTRALSGHLFFIISSILCVISFSYFAEYNSLFNYFLFEGLYDDQEAILRTIWGQYHPVISLICIVVLSYTGIKLTRYIGQQIHAPGFLRHSSGYIQTTFVFILLFVVFIIAARGSVDSRPAMRKWASVTTDPFLNSLVINPVRSMIYAVRDFNELSSFAKNNPYRNEKDIKNILTKSYPGISADNTTTSFIEKKSNGATIEKPQHIFLLIMESYDSWPLQDKFKDLHLTDGLKSIAKQGIHFSNFLPASHSTMNTLASIISGIPYAGVNMSKIGAVGGPGKTSIFEQFKALGYHTNYFYGGLLSWQNNGRLVTNQGVDNAYSASNAGGKGSAGAWGVDDDQLYKLVINKIDPNKPSFNIIMTTTYHGPFNIDLKSKGYHFDSKDDYPAALQSDDALPANVLGHLWFSDKAASEFIQQVSSEYPKSLFAVTGDHYSRRYFVGPPNLYEYSSVPLILYGMNIDDTKINPETIGGHLDIAPTLIELISQAGFSYHSFGHALQYKQPDSQIIGYKKIMNEDKIWKIYPGVRLVSWDGQKQQTIAMPDAMKNNKALLKQYNEHMAVAWQLLMKGDAIPQPQETQ